MGVTESPPPEESPQIKRKKIVDNNKEKIKNILMFNQGVSQKNKKENTTTTKVY